MYRGHAHRPAGADLLRHRPGDPTFCLGLGLIILFACQSALAAGFGHGDVAGLHLPSVALGWYAVPAVMRLARNGMLEVLSADYIRTARAKGLSPSVVVLKHALRNAIIPVVAGGGRCNSASCWAAPSWWRRCSPCTASAIWPGKP